VTLVTESPFITRKVPIEDIVEKHLKQPQERTAPWGSFFGTLSGIAADPIAAPAVLPSAEAGAPAEGPRRIEDLPWSPMQKLTTD
jgi:hypothetical protein